MHAIQLKGSSKIQVYVHVKTVAYQTVTLPMHPGAHQACPLEHTLGACMLLILSHLHRGTLVPYKLHAELLDLVARVSSHLSRAAGMGSGRHDNDGRTTLGGTHPLTCGRGWRCSVDGGCTHKHTPIIVSLFNKSAKLFLAGGLGPPLAA